MNSAATIAGSGAAHGVARHFVPDAFGVYAAQELLAAPVHRAGVCFNPSCGCAFTPARVWQMYCCANCERDSVAELRRWGHRMALPLLVWRLGKYERADQAVRARTNAARRYISSAQTLWLDERRARAVEDL
jgi:hypothetical protein